MGLKSFAEVHTPLCNLLVPGACLIRISSPVAAINAGDYFETNYKIGPSQNEACVGEDF